MTQSEKNKPVKTLKDGYLKVAIWKNPTENGHRYSVGAVQRSYKDKEGKWNETDYLSNDEILRGGHLLIRAYELQLALKDEDYQKNNSIEH